MSQYSMENFKDKPSISTSEVLDGTTRQIHSESLGDFLFAQGHYHASDRFVQMEMLRVIAQGRLCELFQDSPETYAIDKYMRELGIYHYAKQEVQTLTPAAKESAKLYCNGVNTVFSKKRPFEFIFITRHRPQPWKVEDTIATLKVMSYLGLAQGQQDLEKLIIQLLQSGINKEKIEQLVDANLPELEDGNILNLVNKINLYNPLIPKSFDFLSKLPKITASNNWAAKDSNGDVIHACDPHLECNRLPGVWYEMKFSIKDKNYFGISMPGAPGIVMGKTDATAFSFTYGFMDMIDYFIEEIKDGMVRVEDGFRPLKTRKEVIKRQKTHDQELLIRESRNGVLECASDQKKISDGIYLSHAWSGRSLGASKTLEAIIELINADSAIEIKECVKDVAISCNWIITDQENNIIYQQSGLLPKRRYSGLIPLQGWINENCWQGTYDGFDLQYKLISNQNSFVTANNHIHIQDFPRSINAPMGDYRKDRIIELLKNKEPSVEYFKTVQSDLYSRQASLFIDKYKKEFSANEVTAQLVGWDKCYDVNSKMASLFERFYKELMTDFLGINLLGTEAVSYCLNNTSFIADFYGLVDKFFLEDHAYSLWFWKKSKNQFITDAINKLTATDQAWGKINSFDMNNIFFDGKLPKFLGFDYPSIEVPGNRSTISQGSVFTAHSRKTSFCPSWKMITQMNSNEVYSVLAGGLSDRRFSKFYKSDVQNWIEFKYRKNIINTKRPKDLQ